MLGWIIAIILIIANCMGASEIFLIAAGLFAIAGSIGYNLDSISKVIKKCNGNI